MARQKLTQSDRLPVSIDAARKDHSITSSARTRNDRGTVSPSALVVLACKSLYRGAIEAGGYGVPGGIVGPSVIVVTARAFRFRHGIA